MAQTAHGACRHHQEKEQSVGGRAEDGQRETRSGQGERIRPEAHGLLAFPAASAQHDGMPNVAARQALRLEHQAALNLCCAPSATDRITC
jgi:hypothetical protein